LFESIGSGGMATVYRGHDHRLGVQRAIKVLAPAYAAKKRVRARFEAEARTMAVLDHPNIVRVYDVGSNETTAWIVMELIEGGSLVDRIDGPGILVDESLTITACILEALSVAHGHGVVHRDIKPHNILLSEDNIVRLTDFGIARSSGLTEESFTKTGTVMGTWAYMAPEQRVNAKGVDHTADIYGVGATLFSMATKKTPMDLFASDLDPEMLSTVPEALVQLIRKSTRYNREERYPNAQAMLEAVRMRQSRENTVSGPLRTPPPPRTATPENADVEDSEANSTFVAEPFADADPGGDVSITPTPFRPPTPAPSAHADQADDEGTILPDDMEPPPPVEAPQGRKLRKSTVVILALTIAFFVGGSIKRDWNTHIAEWFSQPQTSDVDQPSEVVKPPPVITGPETPAPPIKEPPAPPSKPELRPEIKVKPTPTPVAVDPRSIPPAEPEPEPLEVDDPVLEHHPKRMSRMGGTLIVSTQIKNLTPLELRTYEIVAYYRTTGTAAYKRTVMTRSRSTWTSPIRITADMEAGLEYFIKAKPADAMGGRLPSLYSGKNSTPHRVRITSP
jgi:serine/threonine-protein kinase